MLLDSLWAAFKARLVALISADLDSLTTFKLYFLCVHSYTKFYIFSWLLLALKSFYSFAIIKLKANPNAALHCIAMNTGTFRTRNICKTGKTSYKNILFVDIEMQLSVALTSDRKKWHCSVQTLSLFLKIKSNFKRPTKKTIGDGNYTQDP